MKTTKTTVAFLLMVATVTCTHVALGLVFAWLAARAFRRNIV